MKKLIFIITLIIISNIGFSQIQLDKLIVDTTYRYEFIDGSSRMGKFISYDDTWLHYDDVVFGEMKVKISAIVEIHPIQFRSNGMFDNPHYSRMLFGPTAIAHKKGDLYWNNLLFEANTLQFGVNNNLSIGGGFGILSTFAGYPVIMMNFKYTLPIKSEKWNWALGHFQVAAFTDGLSEDNPTNFSLPFAVGTYGNRERNFTFGLGWPGWNRDSHEVGEPFEFNDYPTSYLAFTSRLSRNWLLQAETYVIPYHIYDGVYINQTNDYVYQKENELLGILLISGRYIKPTSSWDFAVGVFYADGSTIPIPMIGYTRVF